jgi:hypothetical protein
LIVMARLRHEFGRGVPALLVTGETAAENLREALASGFPLRRVALGEGRGRVHPVAAGQLQVQQHRVEVGVRLHHGQALRLVARLHHLARRPAVAQQSRQPLPQDSVILHHEDFRGLHGAAESPDSATRPPAATPVAGPARRDKLT